jgi:hypothetical protein
MNQFDGYMITVSWDGATLRVHGKNKMARVGLSGADHAEDVLVTRGQMADVQFKAASMLMNGAVTIRTDQGRKYILHFRRKQQPAFAQLAQSLGVRV